MARITATHERHFLGCFSYTCLPLLRDRHVEDAVSAVRVVSPEVDGNSYVVDPQI
jgi:hypothetical protein